MRLLKNIRNQLDFYLRNQLTWGPTLPDFVKTSADELSYQSDMREFLSRFSWNKALAGFPISSPLKVVDIGARTFSLAPVLEELFTKQGYQSELHGIEIDAYRRMRDFRTRKNYGDYFARKVNHGEYHAMDFMKWTTPVDIAFFLNPFVSENPLISWGLPLAELKPESLFKHTYEILKPRHGVMVLSCPSPEELEIAESIIKNVGFKEFDRAEWKPGPKSIQTKPRYGRLYHL